jgi:hypothetical protein
MITDGKRLFVTEVLIDNTHSMDQIRKTEGLLENMLIRKKTLYMLYDLKLLVDDIEALRQLDDNQSLILSTSLDGIE